MTHLRSAGSQHSQQLVDFALFESYATYFNIGRTCFTAYSVLGKPMTFLIICILTKSRKPQIFSLRLFKSPIQKPQESCRKIRNTEIYSAGKIKSTSADMVGGHKKAKLVFAGTAWLRSCRFLFYQLVHGNKAHKVIGDTDVLSPFAAALVRRFDVDRLYKLPQSVRGQFL